MKTLLNPCPGFFPSLFRFNQTTRLENRYGFEHDVHLFSSLSRPNEPKDLKTKCFVRVFLPQIPSLYPSERYKDLKRTIPQDRHPSNIPSFRSQNSVKRLESLHSVRTAGSGGRVFGRLGRSGFGGFTFSLSKTALKGGGAGPTGQEDAANNKPPHPGLFTPQKSKKAFSGRRKGPCTKTP